MFGGGGGQPPRPPPDQLDRSAVGHPGRLGEPLARLRVVQAQFALHRPAHVGFPPFRMPDQGPPLDAKRERAAVGLALASLLWLQAMQLAVMPAERSQAHQAGVIRGFASSNGAVGQHPGIHTMGFPQLGQLLARLLELQLLTQFLGLVTLLGLDRGELAQLRVEPRFAHL